MMRWIFVALILLAANFVQAEEPDALQSTAETIGHEISAKPSPSAREYAPPFLAAVPIDQLTALYKSLHAKYGDVVQVRLRSRSSPTDGVFIFACKDSEMKVTLDLEPGDSHRVVGLWFGPAVPRLATLAAVKQMLAALPGHVGFQLERLDDGQVLESLNPDQPLGIGSTFKLYVLATAVHDKLPWDKVVRLQDRYKSWPSGELQDWPEGSPVTAYTLAVKMISHSDNTAADHLLALVGRHRVEAMLPELGQKYPSANIPFLATMELFRLKVDDPLRHEYLAADATGRAALLDKMLLMPHPDVSLINWQHPIALDKLEWFASAADLCRLLAWYQKQNDPTALGIMAVNSGLDFPTSKFSYIGYKGGSELGVLNMTWLLRTRSGHAYALSAGWNDPEKGVDEEKFSGYMLAIADLIESPQLKN